MSGQDLRPNPLAPEPACARSWSAAWLSSAPPALTAMFLQSLTENELEYLLQDWRFWARDDQLPPEAAARQPWTTWLFLGGRGAGKTRAGAEWVRERVETGEARRIALVAET